MSRVDETSPSDIRALAEVLADVLVERGLVGVGVSASIARVLDAAQVALLLGRDRQWVYHHASELGAFRYGNGPKARLGFDRSSIERWKRNREISQADQRAARRRRPSRSRSEGATLIPYEVSCQE